MTLGLASLLPSSLPRGNLLPNLTAADMKTCRFHPDQAPFCPILRVGDVVKFAGQDFAKLASTVRTCPPPTPSANLGTLGRAGMLGQRSSGEAAPPGGSTLVLSRVLGGLAPSPFPPRPVSHSRLHASLHSEASGSGHGIGATSSRVVGEGLTIPKAGFSAPGAHPEPWYFPPQQHGMTPPSSPPAPTT